MCRDDSRKQHWACFLLTQHLRVLPKLYLVQHQLPYPCYRRGHLTCYFSIVGFGTLLLIARGHMLTLWQWLIRTLAISTWCITPREPLHRGCAAVPWSRARVRLLERACEGGWGKPSSARRCRSAGWPERKRYSSRCLSPPPPSVASDLMSSSLLSSLQ